jgi:hypothetical protein
VEVRVVVVGPECWFERAAAGARVLPFRRRAATVDRAMVSRPKTHDHAVTVGELRAFFSDDHVHSALLVEAGRLVAAVERDDLRPSLRADVEARPAAAARGRRRTRAPRRAPVREAAGTRILQRRRRRSPRLVSVDELVSEGWLPGGRAGSGAADRLRGDQSAAGRRLLSP